MPTSKASSARLKPTLRQSSLSFPSKRSSVSSKGDKGKGKADSEDQTPIGVRRSSPAPSTPISLPHNGDEDEIEGGDQGELAKQMYAPESREDVESPSKRRKVATSGSSKDKDEEKDSDDSPEVGVFRSRASIENASGGKTHPEKEEERPYLDELNKTGRWRKHYGEVRAKMGHLEPIHSKGLTSVHHILRVFDLSYEYGPCIGVTRLERWERAHALGLNPPPEVKEILATKEGIEKDEIKQCVFYDEV